MSSFDYCIIIFLLVILLLIIGVYACLLRFNLRNCKERLDEIEKNNDELDLEIEALKLLINKYKSSFPPTIRQDIASECQNAIEKNWIASGKKESFLTSLNEKRWKTLQSWVNRNF